MNVLAIIDQNNKIKNKAKEYFVDNCKKEKIDYEVIFLNEVDDCKISDVDYIFAFGGDGTIMKSAKYAMKINKAILGINIGHIGFLSSVNDYKKLPTVLKNIKNQNYKTIDRTFIKVKIYNKNKLVYENIALNDFAFFTEKIGQMGKYRIFINDEEFNLFHSDGILISTPSGSTAYSFSIGGSIVSPDVSCIILSPLYPHSFNNRSFILNDNVNIKIQLINKNSIIKTDGREDYIIDYTNDIYITKNNKKGKFIVFDDMNFNNKLNENLKSI